MKKRERNEASKREANALADIQSVLPFLSFSLFSNNYPNKDIVKINIRIEMVYVWCDRVWNSVAR